MTAYGLYYNIATYGITAWASARKTIFIISVTIIKVYKSR